MAASILEDSEKKRYLDRIRAVTFREARDAGAAFITRSWVALRLKRSEDFVKRNWRRAIEDCETVFRGGRPEQLSQESKNIVLEASRRRKKSCSEVAKEILVRRNKQVSRHTVYRLRVREGLKPWHELAKPRKTELNIEDRLWFCDFLRDWSVEDFLHLVVSDEFFVYVTRKPNSQNDIIWSKTPDEIPDEERYREVIKSPDCVGVFIMFSIKKLIWIIKPRGTSWDGPYFRSVILSQYAIPFMKDPTCVLDVQEATFLHDKAPCMKALATQRLLKDNEIDFFGNDEWPGNSPDLNVCEHVGAIMKDRVEGLMLQEPIHHRFSRVVLEEKVNEVLQNMSDDTALFESLLRSYPRRIQAVREAHGGNTAY